MRSVRSISARVWVTVPPRYARGRNTPVCVSPLCSTNLEQRAVYVEDDPHDLSKPRGKQDWQLEPHSIWYPRTTGIWQTVWLERLARTYVEKIRWTPHLESYALQFEARVTGDPADDLAVEVILCHGQRLLAKDRYLVVNREVDRMIVLSDPGIDDFRNELLWSPERPSLLDAKVRLLRNGEVIDEFESYTACAGAHPARPFM